MTMSTPIEQNTTALEELLEIAESLPDATEAPVLQEKSVSPSTNEQTVTPDPGFTGLSKVSVSAVKTATQATPSISVSSSGLITASATQTEGYVSAGTKSATQQMTAQAAQTITPGTSNQTIAAGRYLTGIQTILGDSNLIADNIKSGVSIFNVLGTLEATSGGGGSGGLVNGGSAIDGGTFTPSSDVSNSYTINHNLGVAPDFYFLFREGGITEASANPSSIIQAFGVKIPIGENVFSDVQTYVTSGGSLSQSSQMFQLVVYNTFYKPDTFRFSPLMGKLKAGVTYRWCAGVFA
jgi:hypothetical protein